MNVNLNIYLGRIFSIYIEAYKPKYIVAKLVPEPFLKKQQQQKICSAGLTGIYGRLLPAPPRKPKSSVAQFFVYNDMYVIL